MAPRAPQAGPQNAAVAKAVKIASVVKSSASSHTVAVTVTGFNYLKSIFGHIPRSVPEADERMSIGFVLNKQKPQQLKDGLRQPVNKALNKRLVRVKHQDSSLGHDLLDDLMQDYNATDVDNETFVTHAKPRLATSFNAGESSLPFKSALALFNEPKAAVEFNGSHADGLNKYGGNSPKTTIIIDAYSESDAVAGSKKDGDEEALHELISIELTSAAPKGTTIPGPRSAFKKPKQHLSVPRRAVHFDPDCMHIPESAYRESDLYCRTSDSYEPGRFSYKIQRRQRKTPQMVVFEDGLDVKDPKGVYSSQKNVGKDTEDPKGDVELSMRLQVAEDNRKCLEMECENAEKSEEGELSVDKAELSVELKLALDEQDAEEGAGCDA